MQQITFSHFQGTLRKLLRDISSQGAAECPEGLAPGEEQPRCVQKEEFMLFVCTLPHHTMLHYTV